MENRVISGSVRFRNPYWAWRAKLSQTLPREPQTLPYATAPKIPPSLPRYLFAESQRRSATSLVAPYRVEGPRALSLETKMAFRTPVAIQAEMTLAVPSML